MSNISDDKLQEVLDFYSLKGEQETLKTFGLKPDSLRRYLDEAKLRGYSGIETSRNIRAILDSYTEEEIKAIANGGRIMPGYAKVPIISFEGERIRIGHITDTHIGSTFFDDHRLYQAFDEFKKEGVDFITHSGDVSEGMSNRPGHIYELSEIGFQRQKDKCVELLSQWNDTDIYAISGNHDQWFIKSNGADIVKSIDEALPNFHFLGHDEADISLKGQAVLKLWHGGDGNSYALSYRLQKILESLSGGEKPSILIAGHVHKYVSIFERNVFAISVGTLERQTAWMRGKRIAAHVGFVISDYWVNKSGVAKTTHTWYPFYT